MAHCFKHMDKNNKNQIWLQMEYKRAAVMLPLILKRAGIFAAVCLAVAGMLAFCAGVMQQGRGEAKLKVGYTAPSNQLTDLAVSYVQSMESIQSICSLEAVTEQEGRERLENGELSAWIVLPEDLINEILSGSNAPATLYLRESAGSAGGMEAVGSILFEELATAGMGMLGTAQAEIYAAEDILMELAPQAVTDSLLQDIYDAVNHFNLRTAAGREKVFQAKTLSLTGNDTFAVYYGSAGLTVYLLFAGLFFGEYCKRSSVQQTMASVRLGVSYMQQLGARCQAGMWLLAVVFLLPCLVLLIPQVQEVLAVQATMQSVILLLFTVAYVIVYDMMVYQMIEKRESALVVLGVLAVLQAYLSGCIIPSVLLPEAVQAVGRVLPASMIKEGLTMWFTGETQAFYETAWGLLTWGMVLTLATVVSMYIKVRRTASARHIQRETAQIRVPSLGMVLLRRLLHRKSMWIILAAAAGLSAVILHAEQHSETQIRAAFCDESGTFGALLDASGGLVQFVQYESDEAVRRAVQKGDAECGYVLPKTLAANLADGRAKREILVYQGADAVAVPVVNEILFERVFRHVSLAWFEEYLLQNSIASASGIQEEKLRELVAECVLGELAAGTTFRFELRRLNAANEAAPDNHSPYPVYGVAAFVVLLCALQGVAQAVSDLRMQRFYKQNRFVLFAVTVLLPVALGLLCAGAVAAAAYFMHTGTQ